MVRLKFYERRKPLESFLLPALYIGLILLLLAEAVGSQGESSSTQPPNGSQDVDSLSIGREIGKNMSKILDGILTHYDARVRPFPDNDPSKATQILLDLNVRSMGPISEIDRSYSMDCYFRQTWNDPRLRYSGAGKEIAVHIALLEKLWKPDTYFENGKASYIHMITTANKLLRIRPDGTILYSMRLTIKADCPMKLQAYPMDTQYCPLTVLSFAHGANELEYSWKYGNNQSIVVNEDVKLSQFELISYSHVNGSTILKDSFTQLDVSYSSLHVVFKLQRHMGYFLLQVYVPAILLVSMSWVTFWLNREATSDRVGLGITVILTLTTMSRGSDQDLPQVPYATALELYVQMCFTFLILSMFEFVGVHYFTKHGGGDYHNVESDSEGEDDEPTEEQIVTWREERKKEKERRKKMKKSALAQGISMISSGNRYKEETHLRKLLSCLRGSHEYRNSMRRRARKAGHLANSVSRLDMISRTLFPLSFFIINVIYWCVYYFHSESIGRG